MIENVSDIQEPFSNQQFMHFWSLALLHSGRCSVRTFLLISFIATSFFHHQSKFNKANRRAPPSGSDQAQCLGLQIGFSSYSVGFQLLLLPISVSCNFNILSGSFLFLDMYSTAFMDEPNLLLSFTNPSENFHALEYHPYTKLDSLAVQFSIWFTAVMKIFLHMTWSYKSSGHDVVQTTDWKDDEMIATKGGNGSLLSRIVDRYIFKGLLGWHRWFDGR